MLIKHLRKEFYETLIGKRVLLVANQDVDAVCTVKILTELFRIDSISYSLLPVEGLSKFRDKFKEYAHTVKIIILINCGAGVDILEMLGGPTDNIFYVIDSHRPIHIANYYNETNQVRLITLEDKLDVPSFDDLFRSELSDSEEDEEEEEDLDLDADVDDETPRRKRKRNRLDPERLEAKAKWLHHRQELLFNYTQFAYYSLPSALTALELSWTMSRDDLQYVWWAIVALTDAMMMNRLTRPEYTIKATELHNHIARISHSQNSPRDCLKIAFESELNFYLYRHWTLYDSIQMTPYSSAILKTWSLKGEKRFHELLGELGLPLVQCRQRFTSMDLQLRRTMKDLFCSEKVREKYNFESITVGCFIAEIGFKAKYSAFDGQLATLAILENPDKNKTMEDKFMEALDSLSKNKRENLDKGIELAKTWMRATFRQVQAFVNANAVGPRGEFLYACVNEGAPDAVYFKDPSCLYLLAHFTQQAACASARRHKRWSSMPLVLVAPYSPDWWNVIGIRPLNFETPKNLFGKLFETLAEKLPDKVIMDTFDPSVIQVKAEEREKFLEYLEACMI